MTREIKRGYAQDDFFALKEANALAPYPPFENWKKALYERIGDKLPSGNDEETKNLIKLVEDSLHQFYVLRIKIIKGDLKPEELDKFNTEVGERHPEIFEIEGVVEGFRFISEKFPINKQR